MGGSTLDTFKDVAIGISTGGIYNLGKAGMREAARPAERLQRAQQNLEAVRRNELAAEAAKRESDKATAAKRGQTFGRSNLLGGLSQGPTGFGSGNTAPGLGAGNLFGN